MDKMMQENAKLYMEEFYNLLASRQVQARVEDSLEEVRPQLERFVERGVMISGTLVTEESVAIYETLLKAMSVMPEKFNAVNLLEKKLLQGASEKKSTRRILMSSKVDEMQEKLAVYDDMVAWFLAFGQSDVVKRFSKCEMALKSQSIVPDVGAAVMKFGQRVTEKLEDLVKQNKRDGKEWNLFKGQVLNAFFCAENIGNRKVNYNQHIVWEDRLVRLGLVEKLLEREPKNQIKAKTFGKSLSQDEPNAKGKERLVSDRLAINNWGRPPRHERQNALSIGQNLSPYARETEREKDLLMR